LRYLWFSTLDGFHRLMPKDWRETLRTDPRENKAQKKRRRQRASDPKFVLTKDRLLLKLEKHYQQAPEMVTDFFRQFSWPGAPKLKRLTAFFRDMPDGPLKKILSEYVQFAGRFRVHFILRKRSREQHKSPPHFRVVEDLPNPATFHVRVVNGQLVPIGPVPDDDMPIDVSFERKLKKLPEPLNSAIQQGLAKAVRIDDEEGSSCLTPLEQVAYFPEGVTFVLHEAEQPYLLCLVGERVSVEQWRKLSTAVTAILREKFGRGKAGRPKDLQKYRQAKKLLKQPGPLKEKAIKLAGLASNVDTQQSYISRLRKEEEE